MFKKLLFLLSFTIITANSFAQIITGFVVDGESGNILPGASIIDLITNNQIASDSKGLFRIKINKTATITVTFVGYKPFSKKITINSDTTITFGLTPSNTNLQEVSIIGNNSQNSTQQLTYLNQTKITKIPTMLGESDVVKMLATTPGVKQVEGRQGFNVRGSSQDQNLILYDEAIIYNCSHLLGMYSVFNTNAVQSVQFYKTGIPARYGGRLASAMIIEGNAGNMDHWDNRASIGLLASNISVSGPVITDKCSFSFSGRRSYIDKIVLPIANKYFDSNISEYKNGYFFQDYNIKIATKFKKDRLELSTYAGNDAFLLSNPKNELTNDLKWGNTAASIKWKHSFNDKFSTSQSLAWSKNFLEYNVGQYMYTMDLKTTIQSLRFKSDWLLDIKGNPLRFGIEALKHTYNPNNIDAKVKEMALDFGKSITLHAIESAAFIEYSLNIGSKLIIVPGIRYSLFEQIGPYTSYISNVVGQTTDSMLYDPWKSVQMYSYPEPKLLASYIINEYNTLKSSLTYNIQYNQLIPIISSALPTDMWLPSMKGVKPEKALQIAGGYYRLKSKYSFSLEAYYKKMNDVSESAGTMLNFFDAKDISSVVAQGSGEAYGTEISIDKYIGKVNYGISYAFSRSFRTFETLNNGKAFPAKYDKPHDLTVTGSYQMSKHWNFSALFTYSSGVNITMPVSRYFVQNNIINIYGSKNGYRMPAYHRADVAIKYSFKDSPHLKSDLTFSVSNLYNHLNPYYMYYNISGSLKEYRLKVEMKKVYLFPILPSVTYNMSF